MGALYDPRFIATDAAGARLGGATLTVYLAGTTTLATLYSDAALSSPLSNPVTADGAGVFPQIFLAEGTNCDATLKTSAGVTVRSYEDVQSLTADGGELTRTLSDLTRFKIRGSGGVVYIEVGDPSPDNSGGTAEMRGWAGTQGDQLDLNFATVNAKDARLKEDGRKIASTVTTEGTSFSGASVTIPLTNEPAGTTAWRIYLYNFGASNATTTLTATVSFDNAATFKTGASEYGYETIVSAAQTGNSTGAASIGLTDNTLGARAAGVGWIDVATVNSGTGPTSITWRLSMNSSSGYPRVYEGAATVNTLTYGRATHIKLSISSNTISGKYRVEALAGTGDA